MPFRREAIDRSIILGRFRMPEGDEMRGEEAAALDSARLAACNGKEKGHRTGRASGAYPPPDTSFRAPGGRHGNGSGKPWIFLGRSTHRCALQGISHAHGGFSALESTVLLGCLLVCLACWSALPACRLSGKPVCRSVCLDACPSSCARERVVRCEHTTNQSTRNS